MSPQGSDRRIPAWAASLIAGLARDLPSVVTRKALAERLAEAGSVREVDPTVVELRRLGWLVGLPVQGTWAFIPPGQDAVADPYLRLRAWQARDEHACFMLAGDAAAWHLGYLDRRPEGRTPVWVPAGQRLPDGLRPYVTLVKLRWTADMASLLAPPTALLLRRKLDLVSWAAGLPAFGAEALLVQLAARPSSFQAWADLVAHLNQLIDDVDDGRLLRLLDDQSASTWQRAAYVLDIGGHPERGTELIEQRPPGPMPKARFEHPDATPHDDEASPSWSARYHVVDRLVAPLLDAIGKA